MELILVCHGVSHNTVPVLLAVSVKATDKLERDMASARTPDR